MSDKRRAIAATAMGKAARPDGSPQGGRLFRIPLDNIDVSSLAARANALPASRTSAPRVPRFPFF